MHLHRGGFFSQMATSHFFQVGTCKESPGGREPCSLHVQNSAGREKGTNVALTFRQKEIFVVRFVFCENLTGVLFSSSEGVNFLH